MAADAAPEEEEEEKEEVVSISIKTHTHRSREEQRGGQGGMLDMYGKHRGSNQSV